MQKLSLSRLLICASVFLVLSLTLLADDRRPEKDILKEISDPHTDLLADPPVTQLCPDSFLGDSVTRIPFVCWFQPKISRLGHLDDYRLVYSSRADERLERMAEDSIKARPPGRPADPGFRTNWFWHQVIIGGIGPSLDPHRVAQIDSLGGKVDPDTLMLQEGVVKYPAAAMVKKDTGTVWLRVLSGDDGRVHVAMLLKSFGNTLLDNAALRAAYGNKFEPVKFAGRKVSIWVSYRVQYRLP
jgi:TonB family protein